MDSMKIRNSLLLLLTATIWGVAFVAQSAGMDYVGGFTFNCVRSLIGGLVLIPCIFFLRKIRGGEDRDVRRSPVYRRNLITGGVLCGIVMTAASNLQQFGIKYTSVGKAGFITALYIVLVPILGLFLKKRVGKKVALGVVLAVLGLYFLCINEKLTIGFGDLLVLCCALVFAIHILVVDHFSPLVDGVVMSCIQFIVCGLLTAVPMLLFEEPRWDALVACRVPLLYAGVLSCGVAYTLQILGQKNMNPTVASMIMSLESVISVLAGWLILGQQLSSRELCGCALMFAAIVLAQLPDRKTAGG